jgi:hypothetical protein
MRTHDGSFELRRPSRVLSTLAATVLGAVLPLAVGCQECPPEGTDAARPDGGRADTARPDGARADLLSDAGRDARHDAGPPLRVLVEKRLFGEAPAANGIIDPQFASSDGVGWMPWLDYSSPMSLITPLRLARTPLGQPVLRLQRPFGEPSARVIGLGKAAAGPADVSIWLGRRVSDATDLSGASATLLGYVVGQGEQAFDLRPDTATPGKTLSGVQWQRYAATLATAPLGFVYLSVGHNTGVPLYLSSPLLVAGKPQPGGLHAALGTEGRPLRPHERTALDTARRRLRERLGGLGSIP